MSNKFTGYMTALSNLRDCNNRFKISAELFALVPSEQNIVYLTADGAALATAYTKLEAEVSHLNAQQPTVGLD